MNIDQPQWIQYLNSSDRLFSSKIHQLSCGSIDYLFVFGAFVFGSKFMPITILLSIFLVDIAWFIYLLLSCLITVTLTQFGKKLFARHRSNTKTLASKNNMKIGILTGELLPDLSTFDLSVPPFDWYYLKIKGI